MGTFLLWLAVGVLVLMIAIEIAVLLARRRPKKVVRPRHPRRQVLLEERMRDALVAPRAQYGEIFSSFIVWKHGRDTRMEVFTADPWLSLNEFTRSLVVRHVWRALERLAAGAVVIVDQPPLEWSADVNKKFDDHGIDPWTGEAPSPAAGSGPQFIKGP